MRSLNLPTVWTVEPGRINRIQSCDRTTVYCTPLFLTAPLSPLPRRHRLRIGPHHNQPSDAHRFIGHVGFLG